MAKPSGLGKGLGALIPQTQQKKSVLSASSQPVASSGGSSQGSGAPLELELSLIIANPNQPRKHFEHHAMEDLVASVKEHGILQPLVVTPVDTSGKYHLIAGERRLRAATMVGLNKVPVIVRDANEQKQFELAIIENVQRADLNAIEEGRAYKRLMDEFNLTQEEVSKRVGKSRSAIANTVRLLDLAEAVQDAIISGKISMGHAKILAGLDSRDEQESYLKQILQQQLTVRDLEAVASQKRGKKAVASSGQFDPVREAQEEMLRDRLATRVQIKKQGEKGNIIIHFQSLEDLQRLLNELT